jgi:hypothetical protein
MQKDIRTDGRNDMTKLIVAFRNFAKAPGESARENSLQETMLELNFLELAVQYVTLKI